MARESEKAPEQPHPLVSESRRKDIWNGLLALRTVNAILLCTFFQPDEFYQAQEPAWHFAFGKDAHRWANNAQHGAWMTWEWEHKLRSSIYPMILGAFYKVFDSICSYVAPPVVTAKFLLYPPKVLGVFSAALTDYYSWRLGERIFGEGSAEASAVLYLTAASPWQWFVSTRTLSNCAETSLTVIALYYWPWSWFMTGSQPEARNRDTQNLMICFLLAGLATVLRPTNMLIWAVIGLFTLSRAYKAEVIAIARQGATIGFVVIAFSTIIDLFYYRELTLPPLNFLKFNISEGVASFYGMNRPDYYFTEGMPLLLTTAIPFALLGIFDAMTGRGSLDLGGKDTTPQHTSVHRCLATVCLVIPLAMSCLPHKEVRFIYPLLPLLFILSAPSAARFFGSRTRLSRTLLILTVFINLILAVYFGTFHGRGVIAAQNFLCSEHERHNPGMVTLGQTTGVNTTQVAFLMPCHSVPWRSNLIYPDIEAWALTCEPPLHMSTAEKASYVDEADQFYADPESWLRQEFMLGKRALPEYVVFFEQLEGTMKGLRRLVSETAYVEAWRGFNSLVHDDWRRAGDVIVWAKSRDFGGRGRS